MKRQATPQYKKRLTKNGTTCAIKKTCSGLVQPTCVRRCVYANCARWENAGKRPEGDEGGGAGVMHRDAILLFHAARGGLRHARTRRSVGLLLRLVSGRRTQLAAFFLRGASLRAVCDPSRLPHCQPSPRRRCARGGVLRARVKRRRARVDTWRLRVGVGDDHA